MRLALSLSEQCPPFCRISIFLPVKFLLLDFFTEVAAGVANRSLDQWQRMAQFASGAKNLCIEQKICALCSSHVYI